jgi:aldose 1-epimerase
VNAEVITLTDPASDATASVAAGLGFNCFRFCVPLGDQAIDVLWAEPGFESGGKRASGSGIPLLFPYPGRLRGRTLTWRGQVYPLEGDDRRGNAIHGYVLTRPWRVVERTPTRVVGQFQATVDDPALRARWPADFRVTAAYEVSGRALRSELLIENPDDRPLPFGFGTHPYFCIPLGNGEAAECLVELPPVTRRWELSDMLPTGRQETLADPEAFQRGRPFADMEFDDVFTGLDCPAGMCRAGIADRRGGCRLVLEFDAAFRECVVYNPPHREAVCLEPYTCVPNAFELAGAGADTGLRVLEPGASLRTWIEMRVEPL